MTKTNLCPCKSGKSYSKCCRIYHTGKAYPSTPLLLMRSRYSAYVKKNEKYLFKTWHESTRPVNLDLNDITWVDLQIIDNQNDMVHFKAFYKDIDKKSFMEEKSQFVLKKGKWYYLKNF